MDNIFFNIMAHKKPIAAARIAGSPEYKSIRGTTQFFAVNQGVLVYSEVYGLPYDKENPYRVYGCHIHEGDKCAGNQTDPFADTMGHYNPTGKPHPYHAGDLPPLFGSYGFAWNVVFTSRFTINEILGRTVIIHSHPDNFTTQPSGDSGSKIACGVITKF